MLALTEAERSDLAAMAARPKSAQALAQRARIILACAEGLANKVVSRELGVNAMTVRKWRRRFLDQRVDGLCDEPRRGAPRDERIEAAITRTLERQPDVVGLYTAAGFGQGR